MGVNYGKRRGRMEQLGGVSDITAFAIGNKNLKFSHVDEDSYYEEINRKLDRAEERFRNRV